MGIRKWIASGVGIGLVALVLGTSIVGADGSRTYTTDADFDEGTLFNVNHDAPNSDQLQLNQSTTTYPVMWIANAGEDTVSKWDTSNNKELARYHTWFGNTMHGAWEGAAPSRTAVDKDGNCYVANRHFESWLPADVIKIYTNDWVDRNGNGVMDTSIDVDNNGAIDLATETLPMADTNGNNKIDASEIKDERIAWAVTVGPNGGLGRAVAIDPDGNIWVGLYNAQQYYKLSSVNGSILAGPINVGVTPYGALVDKYGILWGVNYDGPLLRLDTDTFAVQTFANPYGLCYSIALGYDANGYTHVYMSSHAASRSYIQFNTNGNVFSSPATDWFNSLGVGTDSAGNIYCSNQHECGGVVGGGVAKFAPNGGLIWKSPTQQCSDSRAAVVDSDGNVWVVLLGVSKIAKYDGATGAPLGTFPTGYLPYTYSDATGLGLRNSIQPQGTWTVIHDTGAANTPWGTVSWTGSEPAGTSLTVKVRSSNDSVNWSPWEDASNGGALGSTPDGRYLQVQVNFEILSGEVSPILYDLTVSPEGGEPPQPSIPGMTQWGVIGMVAALSGIAIFMLNRRRVRQVS